MDPAKIVVVGGYNRDVSLFVPRLPAAGQTVLSVGRLDSAGGKGSNQAVQAARCGTPTAMIAALGDDGAADQALALWAAFKIAVGAVVRLPGQATGMAMILVDAAGENLIVVDPGANALLAPEHVTAASGLVAGAKLVLAQLETPVDATMSAFAMARAAGVDTLLNAAPAPEAIAPELLDLTDVLIVNEGEGRALSGETRPEAVGERLLGKVARAVVVTLGDRGAMLFERGAAPIGRRSPRVEVVDSTGAGDAFTGAFAARWAATADARAALAWGLAAGALSCTKKGAAASCADAASIAALARG
ncbi:MAG TPA: ribokinase [Caulobacteraceae bacterium]|nr:ribokinase [Caulobacteraceae bacterium]